MVWIWSRCMRIQTLDFSSRRELNGVMLVDLLTTSRDGSNDTSRLVTVILVERYRVARKRNPVLPCPLCDCLGIAHSSRNIAYRSRPRLLFSPIHVTRFN